ncbi:hypothetical protein MMC25_004121 [Agyrium rufum]|nr:hypothetical protein [Agyrium rufum]
MKLLSTSIFSGAIALQGTGAFTSAYTRTASSPVALVKNGSYAGVYNPTYKEDFFLGMPYAQPPVGDLRLALPQPINITFSGTRQATQYSPECVGYGGDDIGYEVSEDCLSINVVRPHGTDSSSSMPIAVWIHGGGWVMGGSVDRRYNLSFIVQNSVEMGKPIIGVSINYRLSGFGFLASSEVQEQGLTNLGYRDQRLALQWIQENIQAFGGDPQKVTIWGESAGAFAVGAHAVAYNGRDDGLFRGIIAESGGPLQPLANAISNNAIFDNVTKATGCGDASNKIACLRSVSFDTLNKALNVTPSYVFGPVIDGDFLPQLTSNSLNEGKFTKTPMLIGANSDEGTAFLREGINTDADFRRAVMSVGADANTTQIFEAVYPDILAIGIPAEVTTRLNSTFGHQYKRSAAFFGDYTIILSRRSANEAWANHGVKSYSYRFNVIVNEVPYYVASTHFQEVAFVFNNLQALGYAVSPFENEPSSFVALSKLMSRAWVSFVHDLNPNNHGLKNIPHWPTYHEEPGRPQNFVFDANVTSHPELDTFRAEGMRFMFEVAASQLDR